MPKVSVILAVYNGEKYLNDSIESILNQSFKDFELIIIDDGSIDSTSNIIQSYNSKKIISLQNSKNMGVAYSRNKAVLHSNSEFIAIQDSDDISLFNRLEKQIDFIKENAVVGSYAYKITDLNKEIGLLNYPFFFEKIGIKSIINFKLSPIIDPSSMFNREVFIKHGLYSLDERFRTAQDFELWCRLLNHGYSIKNILEPLIKYRINLKGVTKTKYKEMRESTNLIHKLFMEHSLVDPSFNKETYQQEHEYKAT